MNDHHRVAQINSGTCCKSEIIHANPPTRLTNAEILPTLALENERSIELLG